MELFLAVRKSEEFKRCNPKLIALYDLEEVAMEEGSFIGKRVPPLSTVDQLSHLEEHLASILSRLHIPQESARLIAPLMNNS